MQSGQQNLQHMPEERRELTFVSKQKKLCYAWSKEDTKNSEQDYTAIIDLIISILTQLSSLDRVIYGQTNMKADINNYKVH